MHVSSSRVMKWVSGALEIVLGIPVLGATIVMGGLYIPLGVMLVLHIITLVLSVKNSEKYYGSVLGIITSLVAWIPFVGMTLHIISGILLMVTAAQKNKEQGATPSA